MVALSAAATVDFAPITEKERKERPMDEVLRQLLIRVLDRGQLPPMDKCGQKTHGHYGYPLMKSTSTNTRREGPY